MQYYSSVAVLVLALSCSATNAARLKQSPVEQVVTLLGDVKTRIEQDGKDEQSSYDKYACWCEDTLARKAKDISDAKAKIEELSNLIVKLEGDLGSHEVEIAQLKKDIAANLDSQKEAADVRNTEYEDYTAEKTESEQCIGALEAAIKVLTGAGTGKFLQTLQEAQMLSVAAGVRAVLSKPAASHAISDQDMQVVKHFVAQPADFVGRSSRDLSAVQIAQNPFGDYAPQSTQIQGILKGMYDAFAADLEKDNAAEADKEKAFRAFMATKKRELETLQATLQTQELTAAQKTKQLADSKVERDDTTEQLAADEQFFAETKKACSVKAQEWSSRCGLRTAELQGIAKAVEILSSETASKTFGSAFTTLVQVASVTRHTSKQAARDSAFQRLKAVATKYHNAQFAELAAEAKTNGHFDKVISMIDAMIEVLRKEEQSDIEHRDRCENAINKNSNDKEDLESGINKADDALTRMNNTQDSLRDEISGLEDSIKSTKSDMVELLDMRNKEVSQFRTAMKDDADAIKLIEQAIVSLAKFYKDNNIPLELIQRKQDPEYTVDPDKAPETSWTGGDYGGRKGESEGIIAILEMIVEDLQKEMKVAREEDAEAQADYDKSMGALKETMSSQKNSLVNAESELAELQGKMVDTEAHKGQLSADKESEEALSATLTNDCDWVNTHFESRRTKRKAEMDGLVDAKNYLAGAVDEE